MLELYANIRNRRKELGMSQDELAKKVGYTSRSTIARIENGEIDLPQSKIKAFADALKTTPGELMGWEGTLEEELAREYHFESREVCDYLIELSKDPEVMALLTRVHKDKHFKHRLLTIANLLENDK